MQQVIDFLCRLRDNNNREWMQAHKEEYKAAQARFDQFTEELIGEIAQFDPSVAGLTVKDCNYRIYRDTRFSADKTPYKTHMGCFVCRGGKKSGFAGYYFQASVERDHAHFGHLHWDTQSIIAPGHYCIEPKALQVLREDIVHGEGDFHATVQQAQAAGLELLTTDSLKRNPKGFDRDAPWGEYLRLRSFCMGRAVDEDFLLAPNLPARLAAIFREAQPFLDYINRAVAYAREEMQP